MKNLILLSVGLLVLVALLTFMFYRPKVDQKEKFVAVSGFRSTGCKNKQSCRNAHLNQYALCLARGDHQGECWSRAEPRLVACEFTKY